MNEPKLRKCGQCLTQRKEDEMSYGPNEAFEAELEWRHERGVNPSWYEIMLMCIEGKGLESYYHSDPYNPHNPYARSDFKEAWWRGWQKGERGLRFDQGGVGESGLRLYILKSVYIGYSSYADLEMDAHYPDNFADTLNDLIDRGYMSLFSTQHSLTALGSQILHIFGEAD